MTDLALLDRRIEELLASGADPKTGRALRNFIEEAPAARMYAISPYRLAEDLSLSQDEMLDAFLLGVLIGLFELEWNFRCPACGVGETRAQHLQELEQNAFCNICRIDLPGEFDETIELKFNVSHDIRREPQPELGDSILAWFAPGKRLALELPAGAVKTVQLKLDHGPYAFFYDSAQAPLALCAGHGESTSEEREIEVTINAAGCQSSLASSIRSIRPGPVRLTIRNQDRNAKKAELVHGKPRPWVRAMDVALNRHFHEHFSTELIHPKRSYAIRNLVFLFTDLRGSTNLYEQLGDARAYSRVQEHFDILSRCVAEHRGAVVKTVGDAIMAVFKRSNDALRAVQEMHEQLRERTELVLKTGLHRGPAIAVNSNERLDYFGRTVNLAARLQGLSRGGDLILSRSLAEEPALQPLLKQSGLNAVKYLARLKGIAGEYPIARISLAESDSMATMPVPPGDIQSGRQSLVSAKS
ncbi:MAG: adenylate/guanylate cyclase domain-containing protein [Leptospirales bacterium]|nr:adenylate/guanylate cyclase domain-containing protein [Leptospirales bacterium]